MIDKHPFQYHKPTEGQANLMGQINAYLKNAYEAILLAPPSRERSLSITKLQEARMWVNAGIVLNDEPS